MSKNVIYFLMNQVTLIMGFRKIFFIFAIYFYTNIAFTEVIYNKQDLIITDIDIKIYKKLYENNYGSKIDNNNALKDLVLINNLINHFEKNNKEFLDQIDYEISIQYGNDTLKEINFRDFLRFSMIRDEFIIYYFNNRLTSEEILKEFEKLDSLELPISKNDCIIIEEIVDLKNNIDFIKTLLENLKNGSRNLKILLDDIEYKICLNDDNLRSLELLIVRYIETQTGQDFKDFVYGKTKN